MRSGLSHTAVFLAIAEIMQAGVPDAVYRKLSEFLSTAGIVVRHGQWQFLGQREPHRGCKKIRSADGGAFARARARAFRAEAKRATDAQNSAETFNDFNAGVTKFNATDPAREAEGNPTGFSFPLSKSIWLHSVGSQEACVVVGSGSRMPSNQE